MINIGLLLNLLSISDRSSVWNRALISAVFMLALGQVQVMKVRAGIPITVDLDWISWSFSLIFFIALWGRAETSIFGFIRYTANFFVWTVAVDAVRFGMAYLMLVVLFPSPEFAVVP